MRVNTAVKSITCQGRRVCCCGKYSKRPPHKGFAKTLGQSRETAQRQLNAEKKKRKEGPRIESLNKQLSEKHEKITMVEEMMRRIFTGHQLLNDEELGSLYDLIDEAPQIRHVVDDLVYDH